MNLRLLALSQWVALLACSDGGKTSADAEPGGIDAAEKPPCEAPFTKTPLTPEAVDRSDLGEAYIFDQSKVHHFDIRVSPQDLASLDANPRAETYVDAEIDFEGIRYSGAGLRYKGGYNTLEACVDEQGNIDRTQCRKLSLKLSFNHAAKCGRFFGVRKVNLNSMSQDQSLLRDRMSNLIMSLGGATTPRVVYATATINGQHRGIFAMIEQVDQEFIDERYKSQSGDLYKSVWPTSADPQFYKPWLETNAKTSDASRMVALYQKLEATNQANFRADVAGLVDATAVARRIAIGHLIGDTDGPSTIYCFPDGNGGNACQNGNYYWYDSGANGFDLITWDLDGSLSEIPLSLSDSLYKTPRSNCQPIQICSFLRDVYGTNDGCTQGATMMHPACDPLIRLSVATSPTVFADTYAKIRASFANGSILAAFDQAKQQLQSKIALEAAHGLSSQAWNDEATGIRDSLLRMQTKLGQ